MIKALIFDLGGVLVSLRLTQVLENLEQLFGPTTPLLGSAIHLDYEKGYSSTEQYFQQVLTKFNKVEVEISFERFQNAWNSILGPQRDGMVNLVRKIRLNHPQYELYLLSNTSPLHWEVLRERDHYDHLFNQCFLSFEMGESKPGPSIYRTVLEQIGKQADECIFLDDNRENIKAAQRVGMNTIHVKLKKDAFLFVKQELGKFGIDL